MHYYLLGFGYQSLNREVTKSIQRDSDSEFGHGSYYLMAAEEYVEELAKNSNLDLQHAYSWPDGSLYKYLRSLNPIDSDELHRCFLGKQPRAIKSSDGVEYLVTVWLENIREKDATKVSATELLSLSERWVLSRQAAHKLYMERYELRRKCFDIYYQHRNSCSKCPKQGLPCDEGFELCKEAEAAADRFVQELQVTV